MIDDASDLAVHQVMIWISIYSDASIALPVHVKVSND